VSTQITGWSLCRTEQ